MVESVFKAIVFLFVDLAIFLPFVELGHMTHVGLLLVDGLLQQGLLDELLEVLLLFAEEEAYLLLFHVDHRAEMLAEEASGVQLFFDFRQSEGDKFFIDLCYLF